jgi:hypothetical protein
MRHKIDTYISENINIRSLIILMRATVTSIIIFNNLNGRLLYAVFDVKWLKRCFISEKNNADCEISIN